MSTLEIHLEDLSRELFFCQISDIVISYSLNTTVLLI